MSTERITDISLTVYGNEDSTSVKRSLLLIESMVDAVGFGYMGEIDEFEDMIEVVFTDRGEESSIVALSGYDSTDNEWIVLSYAIGHNPEQIDMLVDIAENLYFECSIKDLTIEDVVEIMEEREMLHGVASEDVVEGMEQSITPKKETTDDGTTNQKLAGIIEKHIKTLEDQGVSAQVIIDLVNDIYKMGGSETRATYKAKTFPKKKQEGEETSNNVGSKPASVYNVQDLEVRIDRMLVQLDWLKQDIQRGIYNG